MRGMFVWKQQELPASLPQHYVTQFRTANCTRIQERNAG